MPHGPCGASGSSGSTTTATMRNFAVAMTSSREIFDDSSWRNGLVDSSSVAVTESAATTMAFWFGEVNVSCVPHRAPIMKLKMNAPTELSPTWPSSRSRA